MAEKRDNEEGQDKEEKARKENDVSETAQDLHAVSDPGHLETSSPEQYTDGGRLVQQCTDPGGGYNPVCGTACLQVPPQLGENQDYDPTLLIILIILLFYS